MNLLVRKNKKAESRLRNLVSDERGQVLPFMAFVMIGMLGISTLVLDAGRAFIDVRELQAATDAAALAGAGALPDGPTAISRATTYSADAGDQNSFKNLANVSMVSGYPALRCLSTLQSQGYACASPANANAVQVKQQVTVPTFIGGMFGHSTITLGASAMASLQGSAPGTYNIAVVVDTTASMSNQDNDPACNNTRIYCALEGVRILLQTLAPCSTGLTTCGTPSHGIVDNPVDSVSLLTFPPVSTATVQNDYNCQGNNPAIVPYQTPVPVTVPELPVGSTYQIVPFSSDYKTSYGATGLNPASSVVIAVAGKPGCNGMQTPGGDGTYYAGVIYAAGNYLAAAQAANPGSKNVLIFLSDGDSNAASTKMPGASLTSGLFPSVARQCQQAITAAQVVALEGTGGTAVYSVAYGAESTGCATDNGALTPCTTMAGIASSPSNFYSDYTATGSGGCVSSQRPATGLKQIFTQIAQGLTKPRLIPDSTT